MPGILLPGGTRRAQRMLVCSVGIEGLDPVAEVSRLLALRYQQHVIPKMLLEIRPRIRLLHHLLQFGDALFWFRAKADVIEQSLRRRVRRLQLRITHHLFQFRLRRPQTILIEFSVIRRAQRRLAHHRPCRKILRHSPPTGMPGLWRSPRRPTPLHQSAADKQRGRDLVIAVRPQQWIARLEPGRDCLSGTFLRRTFLSLPFAIREDLILSH